MKNVLVACECSQTVCAAFRGAGFNAFSCDIVSEYGGHPEWHILGDCFNVIRAPVKFHTCDGKEHYIEIWDLIIAHPPCTYLCSCQAHLYNTNKYGVKYVSYRREKQNEAISFFMLFTRLKTKVAIENPVGIMSRLFRKPDQIINPYDFGNPERKKTCLWLFGLPKLIPTIQVIPENNHEFKCDYKMGEWMYRTSCLPQKDRSKARSKTFEGIAQAMAHQWGEFIQSH